MRGRRRPETADQDLVIDISAAINQRAGIGRYARELTARLIPLLSPEHVRLWYAEDEQTYDSTLLERDPWRKLAVRKAPISRLNVDRLVVRENLPLLRLLRIGHPTDVYSPDFTAPSPQHARTHITVHDLAWLHPEAETPPPIANFLGPVVQRSVRTATTVFTVSQTIRDEILHHFLLPDDRVIVAPNGAAEHFFGVEPLSDDALVALGVRHPFVLVVGTIEPRKNLRLLFEAVDRLPTGIQLAVAGRSGWNAPAILNRVDELGLAGRVIRFGFFPDELLPRLMASADAVVNPSRYEGFGLPIIEALAAGVPVAASDLPVFREVGGSVVDYFDPQDPADIADAIVRAISRERTEGEQRRSVEQARRFDWASSAAIVAQRLQDVA